MQGMAPKEKVPVGKVEEQGSHLDGPGARLTTEHGRRRKGADGGAVRRDLGALERQMCQRSVP